MIHSDQTVLVPIDGLIPHPDNPRRGDVEAIRASMRTNGFYGSIVAQIGTSHILVGNHRFEAAKLEGYDEVPVMWIAVDDEQAKRILLADNRSSDLAWLDDEKLREMLAELGDTALGLEGTLYDMDEMERMVAGFDLPTFPALPDIADEDTVPAGAHGATIRIRVGNAPILGHVRNAIIRLLEENEEWDARLEA